MKIHEYQAKALFAQFGVAVPPGTVALAPAEVPAAIAQLAPGPLAVKAQIQAGGRGKAGGVRLAGNAAEAQTAAAALLGATLHTAQTGPRGRVVRAVYFEQQVPHTRQLYCALLVDRDHAAVAVLMSAQGGVDIEQVAATDPSAILRESLDLAVGWQGYQSRRLGFALGLSEKAVRALGKTLPALCRLFIEKDCALVEINPLVVTPDDQLVALDGKISFDPNALYRHPDVAALRDIHEEEPTEVAATEAGLSYIRLDGRIGCLVNGAGLAMATMDIIKAYGAEPANFLDIGGGATADRVAKSFELMLHDDVDAILVNIFGGIVRCDMIAEGLLRAFERVRPQVPIVVRLAGTNVDAGKSILAGSGLPIVPADTLREAAEKVVAAARRAA